MTAINSNRAIRGPVTAVPVVAGKGVRLVADTENNRWVVEADETVLWTGSASSANTAMNLSESVANFDRLRFYLDEGNSSISVHICECMCNREYIYPSYMRTNSGNDLICDMFVIVQSNNGSTLTLTRNVHRTNGTSSTGSAAVIKIVGINRIASA